jgi:hypothetical protein
MAKWQSYHSESHFIDLNGSRVSLLRLNGCWVLFHHTGPTITLVGSETLDEAKARALNIVEASLMAMLHDMQEARGG